MILLPSHSANASVITSYSIHYTKLYEIGAVEHHAVHGAAGVLERLGWSCGHLPSYNFV